MERKQKPYQLYGDVFRVRKEARETWDYFVSDEIVYVVQEKNIETGTQPFNILNRYLNGNLWVELVFRHGIEGPLGECQHRALFEPTPECNFVLGQGDNALMEDRNQDSMLVKPGQVIQDAQEKVWRGIPSIVRLKAFNDLSGVGSNRPGGADEHLRGGRSITEDGECDASLILFSPGNARNKRQLPRYVIERRSEIRNNISDNQAPCDWRFFCGPDTEFIYLPFRIIFHARGVRLAFDETIDSSFERADMYLRPMNLQQSVV